MLQAQVQNAMQFKCVQMSLDDSQTSQQTLVQWHQCQCCIVCPCVHAEQPGYWVAADSLICASMFSGDAVMRSCIRQKKLRGTNTLLVPPTQKLGDFSSPVPVVVAPMRCSVMCADFRCARIPQFSTELNPKHFTTLLWFWCFRLFHAHYITTARRTALCHESVLYGCVSLSVRHSKISCVQTVGSYPQLFS